MQEQATQVSGWVSLNETAEYWSISRDSVRRIVSDLGIERRKVGKSVRIRRKDMINLGLPVEEHPLDFSRSA